MNEDGMASCLLPFLFDDLDISATFVRLGPVWRQMLEKRNYPGAVARLLGELSTITVLLAGKLKQPGRLTVQLRGSGPLSLLIIDCNEGLQIRGMARFAPLLACASTPELLGDGQLLLSLEMPSMRSPYQSIVPLAGESISEIFAHYLGQSDQLVTRFFLAATTDEAAGLLLQKLPAADQRDADGWARIEAIAATVHASELLSLPGEDLLRRLFHDQAVRLFPARTITYNCPEDWEKVRSMLRALGRREVEATLHEQGEVLIKDEICNREYRFNAQAIADLFDQPASTPPPTIH